MSYKTRAAFVLSFVSFCQGVLGILIADFFENIYKYGLDFGRVGVGIILFCMLMLPALVFLDGWNNLGHETNQKGPKKTLIQRQGRWRLGRSLREHPIKVITIFLLPYLLSPLGLHFPNLFWPLMIANPIYVFIFWWRILELGKETREIEVMTPVHDDLPPPADDQFGPH